MFSAFAPVDAYVKISTSFLEISYQFLNVRYQNDSTLRIQFQININQCEKDLPHSIELFKLQINH